MALIDVAIPNYNYGRYLPECVDSIRRQGIDDIRILIVDNASTDDSLAVARTLAAEDPRIEILAREKNLGHHASYNAAVDWAASRYFMLLCADDLLVPGCFRRALEILERDGSVAFAAGAELVWRSEAEPFPAIDDPQAAAWRLETTAAFALARSLPAGEELFGSGAALIRTSDLRRVGHYRSDIAFNEDLEHFLRLSVGRRIALTSAVHGVRRVHGANMSAALWERFRADLVDTSNAFEFFFETAGASLPDAARLRRQVRSNLGKRAYWSAVSHLARGRPGDAVDLFRIALGLSPRLAVLPPLGYLWRFRNPARRVGEALRGIASGVRGNAKAEAPVRE